ncbi:MAG TPA: PAS domain S-box protein [Alphaproteobacteria bacterium]|nr:PAS domain S-box protein [Alphaproteobacteria bacterium]
MNDTRPDPGDILDTLNEMVCRFRPDTTITYANRRYRETFGAGAEAGRRWLDLVPAAQQETSLRFVAELRPDRRTVLNENHARLADGSEALYEWCNTGIFDASGRLVEIQGVGRDVTQARQLERRVRDVHGIAQLGYWEVLYEPFRLSLSPECYAIFDRDPDAAPEAPSFWLDAVHPEDRDRVAGLIGSDETIHTEFRVIHRDGSIHTLYYEGRSAFDDKGRKLRRVGIVQDVTLRKRTAAALIESQADNQRLLAALEVSPVTLCIADALKPDLPLVYVNRAFTSMTGYSAEEAVGRNCRFLQGPHTDPESLQAIRDGLASARPFRAEVVNYRKDGAPFLNEMSISPVRDRDGRITAYAGVLIDITERRRRETLERQRLTLEALGEMTGGVAHELNNLLQPIITLAAVAQQRAAKDGTPPAYLQAMLESARRARVVLSDVLAFARRNDRVTESTALGPAIEAALEQARKAVPDSLTVRLDIRTEEPVQVDRAGLTQVLTNLLRNAADAMSGEGVVTVTLDGVTLEGRDADGLGLPAGRFACLRVQDSGGGMDEATRSRVFDPFFTTKPIGKGTGLGLAVVYGIVKNWGGTVTAESHIGAGATFRIFIPVLAGRPG